MLSRDPVIDGFGSITNRRADLDPGRALSVEAPPSHRRNRHTQQFGYFPIVKKCEEKLSAATAWL
jgi:hypothetical protein